MAALGRAAPVRVRAPFPGEGRAIAALWRDLWEAHEAWGGYPGSRDPIVYEHVALRLDDDSRARAGHPILGRHVHVVADLGGALCGQVEGWLEQLGIDEATPFTCELRSLIVAMRARTQGAGRALLDTVAHVSRSVSRGGPCVLAAEVLERNPARAFYAHVGYTPVAWSARIEAATGAAGPQGPFRARPAAARDALAVARLETLLAARRRANGDARFDRPRPLDATLISAIASRLGSEAPASLQEPATLVVTDGAGIARGAASLTVHSLEPPFAPRRRALAGRFAFDTACPTASLLAPLVVLACKLSLARGAQHVELTDLSAPGTQLHDAALAVGARAWSQVVTKFV